MTSAWWTVVDHRGGDYFVAEDLAPANGLLEVTISEARSYRAETSWKNRLAASATWNSTAGAELLFQVLTEREETASVAIASNESLAGPRPSPTPASAPRSSTASPSTPPSSRPAPSPTASPAPGPAPPSRPPEPAMAGNPEPRSGD